jgi:predicted nucleic acid-binding protein
VTLVDTTLWIAWLRESSQTVVSAVDHLLDEGEAAICPVILQEILQGATDPASFRSLHTRFSRLPMLMPDNAVELHVASAELYARCRWIGVTPRSPHDCVIAATAVWANITLLHDDADFDSLAKAEPRLRSKRLSRSHAEPRSR